MIIKFEFDRKKALEVIIFLANRITNAQVYTICKLLYRTDKTSLKKYGRFLFGDSYCAMPKGAVPSNAYDLLKEARETSINGLKVKGNLVTADREADLELLSESDIECLNEIIGLYQSRPKCFMRDEAHDDAYKKNWDKRGKKESHLIPKIDIAEDVDKSGDLKDYISNFG